MVVMRGYEGAMASADAPTITSTSKVCVYEGEELITNIQALAETPVVESVDIAEEEEVAEATTPKESVEEQIAAQDELSEMDIAALEEIANIEPAAGGESRSNSGYGFNSRPGSEPLGSLDDVGPIDPTALQYGVDFQRDDVFMMNDTPDMLAPPAVILDETDLAGGPLVANGRVIVNFGNDGAGSITPDGSVRVGGSVDNDVLASGGVPVTITATSNGYVGYAGAVQVFSFTIDPLTGDYVFTQYAPIDHADGSDPDDVIRFEFGITARDADGDAVSSAIRVDIHDDAPEISSTGGSVDETDLSGGPVMIGGQVLFNYGQDVAANGFGGTGDFTSSGSQLAGQLTTAGGQAVSVSFDPNTGAYTGTAEIDSVTVNVFTMVVHSDGTYQFTLLRPLDHADPDDPNDIIHLDFGVGVTDYDGDSAQSVIRVDVRDDVPVIGNSSGSVDETFLDDGNLVYIDTVPHSFGADLGTVEGSDVFNSSAVLTSGGEAVTVTYDPATQSYIGATSSGAVFTLVINAATGQYTYTQFSNLDHPDTGNPDDLITLEFGVVVRSVDGSNASANITVRVADDGPVANDDYTSAEERQLITGDVTANDELSTDGPNTVVNIQFEGVDYTVPDGGSRTIETDLGTLTINSDGTYEYRAVNGHPDGTDLFTYTLRDADGDTDTANLSIRVTPDGTPVAVSAENTLDETNMVGGQTSIEGDMHVDFGVDGRGATGGVTAESFEGAGGSLAGGTLTSNGVPVNVSLNGNIFTGMAGTTPVFTLEINGDGTYRFTLLSHIDHADSTDPNDLINLTFGVRVTDADGDYVTGDLVIQIHDDAPVALDDGTINVREGNQASGNVTDNDLMSADAPNHVVDVNGVAIPSDGSNITIVGDFGVLTINNTGAYTYNPFSNDPEGVDRFTYTLQDSDGDRDTAALLVNVTPDYDPVIVQVGGADHVDETDLGAGIIVQHGTMVADYFGEEPVAENISGTGAFGFSGSAQNGQLTHNGQTVNVSYNAATNTYTGTAGGTTVFTLAIQSDGHYTFRLLETLDHANGNDPDDVINLEFGVSAVDADGDIGETTLVVAVHDDAPSEFVTSGSVDETSLDSGSVALSGSIDTNNFGQDGPGSAQGSGFFSSTGSRLDNALTHNGAPVTVTYNAANNTYTGTAGGVTVFTMQINANGDYNFRLLESLDHANGNDANDVINLNFGVRLTDSDGDSSGGVISVRVHDDGPDAQNDNGGTTSGQHPVRWGNVMTNDDVGADGPGTVTQVTINGTTVNVPANGSSVTINGTHGVLIMNSVGGWRYTANDGANGTDVFTYRLRDSDGDTDTATLTVTARDGVPVAVNDVQNIGTGMTGTGNVLTNDSPGPDGGLQLTTPGTYTGTFGTLVLHEDGTYVYTRFNQFSTGTDVFEYTIRDADGDTDTATLSIGMTPTPWTPPVSPEPPGDGDGGNGGDGCPLIIDLTGMGINLTSRADGVAFDMDQDGVADWTAWAGVGSGFLVKDHNNDGIINNRSEMFGDTGGFTDGFDNLASYDVNEDGVIDINDDVWSELRVWHDLNQDGISDENEMLTLEQIGIVGIRLNASLPEGLYIEGNWISHVSSVIMADGTERAIIDAWLQYDRGYNGIEADGTESVYGTDGADSFLFAAIGEAATTVHDFDATQGDRLDLSSVLQGQDDVSDAINDFVYARQDGDDLVISVDVSGSGDVSNAHDIARLDGMADLDLDSLLQNGNIVI
jgi:T1SS-143 domain-containing protein